MLTESVSTTNVIMHGFMSLPALLLAIITNKTTFLIPIQNIVFNEHDCVSTLSLKTTFFHAFLLFPFILKNNESTTPIKRKGLVYTEIEAKECIPSIRMTPPMHPKGLANPPPVYTEVILPPKKMMDNVDYHLDERHTLETSSSSRDSTPVPRSLSPSVSPSRTIFHSPSPERNKMSPTASPSPPPRPQQLTIRVGVYIESVFIQLNMCA